MYKFLLVFVFVILTGCETITKYATLEQNPKCEDITEVQVLQTLDDGALALNCDKNIRDSCFGIVVFVPKQKDVLLYDKKKISAPQGQCFVFNDVYSYINKEGDGKTVPMIGFEDRFPNM
ncbi:hypothetical protein HDR61_04045 [bacterium]|nr:hypothetical protein [bacterium]